MDLPNKLYKTTIVIWSAFDPSGLEIDEIAEDAVDGASYCSAQRMEVIEDPDKFPDTDFFGADDYDKDND